MSTMNVLGYLRVSSKGQIDGDGLNRQQTAIEKFCDAHKLDCVEVFEERGVSGTVEGLDRPAFAALIQFVEQSRGEGDVIEGIVVERMDRLARDLMISEVLIGTCRKNGLKVYSADQGALIDMSDDSADPTRTLIRQLMAALAQWEKTMLVRKMSAAKDRIRAATGHCEGAIPFGRMVNEPKIISIIVQASAAGLRLGDIARELTEAGYRTRADNVWDRKNVWRAKQTIKKKNLGQLYETDVIEAEQIAAVFRVDE